MSKFELLSAICQIEGRINFIMQELKDDRDTNEFKIELTNGILEQVQAELEDLEAYAKAKCME